MVSHISRENASVQLWVAMLLEESEGNLVCINDTNLEGVEPLPPSAQ